MWIAFLAELVIKGEYRQVLGRAQMAQSMSRPDNCYDNAFLESCFGKLKTELPMEIYGDVRAARAEIRAYLYYYDTKRRHSFRFINEHY